MAEPWMVFRQWVPCVIGMASGSLECTVAEPWMVFRQWVPCVMGIAGGSLECTVAKPWIVFWQRVPCVIGIASGSLEHSSFICSLVYCPYKPHNINVMIIFPNQGFPGNVQFLFSVLNGD